MSVFTTTRSNIEKLLNPINRTFDNRDKKARNLSSIRAAEQIMKRDAEEDAILNRITDQETKEMEKMIKYYDQKIMDKQMRITNLKDVIR